MMRKFISFSGGVESTTMCVLFGKKADAIFADTGYEHQVLYDRIDLVEKWVRRFHRENFKIHRIIPAVKHKGVVYHTLPDYIRATEFYPSFKSRYCTAQFKIKPIDNFLKQFEEEGVELMIGLNYEEIEQRTGNHGNLPFVKYSYPLADNKISREGCKMILRNVKLLPNFPVYMKRGGCIGCFYKSKSEYIAMAALAPNDFEIVEKLEKDSQGTNKKEWSIIPNLPMYKLRAFSKMGLFKPEEIYPKINDATNCGVFCNR